MNTLGKKNKQIFAGMSVSAACDRREAGWDGDNLNKVDHGQVKW